MKSSIFNTRFSENDIELSPKVINDLKPGICNRPLVFWSENVLDVVIPYWWNKNIMVPFRLLGLVICKHLDDFLCQWKNSMVSILDKPFPCILGALLSKWKDAFKVMRRNCETDWAQRYPQYAVSAWIGHSIEVSAKHYLQIPEELYEKVSATNQTQTATKSKNETHEKN